MIGVAGCPRYGGVVFLCCVAYTLVFSPVTSQSCMLKEEIK